MTREEHQSLLNMAKDLYSPSSKEEAVKKLGNGHEIEHNKGASERMNAAVDIFNANKTQAMKNNPQYDIDKIISSTVATFHDIGNTIDRGSHNHIGRGIIQGELLYSDILSVPIKKLSAEQQELVKECFSDEKKIRENLTKLNQIPRKILIEKIILPKAIFEIGYNCQNPKKVLSELSVNFKFSKAEYDLSKKAIDKIDVNNSEKLKALTKEINRLFNKKQINTIAEAIQDHNIDYNNDGSRYMARNIYGSLIADTDKDDVAMTFAYRTFAYAINKWTKDSSLFMDGDKASFVKCASHILHQAWERYRINCLTAPHTDIHTYKHIDNINGVSEASSNEYVKEFVKNGFSIQEAMEIVAAEHGYLLCSVPENPIDAEGNEIPVYLDAGKPFFVLSKDGADTHSQLDTIISNEKGEKSTPYMDSKEDFTGMISYFSDTKNEKECLEDLTKLLSLAWNKEDSTIEAIINVPEILKWIEKEVDISIKRIMDEYQKHEDIQIGTADSIYNEQFTYEKVVEEVTREIDYPEDFGR